MEVNVDNVKLLIQQVIVPLSEMPEVNETACVVMFGRIGVVIGEDEAVFVPTKVLYDIADDFFEVDDEDES